MKLSSPIRIFNLDEFLPVDGESSFALHFSNGVLLMEIFYEDEESSSELMRSFRFESAKYFFKTPFPGYSFFTCVDDREISLLNSLVQYQTSEMLKQEMEASGASDYKHYRVFLHSSGVAIHVIAKTVVFSM
jgi:hypothetical protein